MTYLLYDNNPYNDEAWVKRFRKIKKVAKETGMVIVDVDYVETKTRLDPVSKEMIGAVFAYKITLAEQMKLPGVG